VADHERIPLREVWDMNVIEYLNDLDYIKSFDDFQDWANRKRK
jgi:hypothetical protein